MWPLKRIVLVILGLIVLLEVVHFWTLDRGVVQSSGGSSARLKHRSDFQSHLRRAVTSAHVADPGVVVPSLEHACDGVCVIHGENFRSTCNDRIQLIANTAHRSKSNACALAHAQVVVECPDCTQCGLAHAQCSDPGLADEDDDDEEGKTCRVMCALHGVSSSCRDRVQWVAVNVHDGHPQACKQAHDRVLEECPVCSVCTFEAMGCSEPTPDATDALDMAGLPKMDAELAAMSINTSGSHCSLRAVAEGNAIRKIRERTAYFHTETGYERLFFRKALIDNFVAAMLLTPYYPCLWTLRKTSSVLNSFAKGGRWVCGITELAEAEHRPIIVYSIGSNYDRSFEDAISETTSGKCEVHIYDPTMGHGNDRERLDKWLRQLPSNFHFHQTGIVGEGVQDLQITYENRSGTNFTAVTLAEAFEQNRHTADIDILKFDIESYEYELLDKLDWEQIRIGLVFFELHANIINTRLSGDHSPNAEKKLYKLRDFHRQLLRMELAGYRVYSLELVCGACVGQFEVALIHRSWDPRCGFSCPCAFLTPNTSSKQPQQELGGGGPRLAMAELELILSSAPGDGAGAAALGVRE